MYYIYLLISFIIGYFVSQMRKPVNFSSIINIIDTFARIWAFDSNVSSVSSNHKFYEISTVMEGSKEIVIFYIPTITTHNIIHVKGIRDKTQDEID